MSSCAAARILWRSRLDDPGGELVLAAFPTPEAALANVRAAREVAEAKAPGPGWLVVVDAAGAVHWTEQVSQRAA